MTDASPGGLPATMAVDGNFGTRWGSLFLTDPSWIYMDFGKPAFIAEVDILWQAACASAYDIDVSNDAVTWNKIRSITTEPAFCYQNPPTGWVDTDAGTPAYDAQTGLNAVGRYVRVNGTARALSAYGYSIWEMRALGDTNAICTP